MIVIFQRIEPKMGMLNDCKDKEEALIQK